jgi:hypothetical protein
LAPSTVAHIGRSIPSNDEQEDVMTRWLAGPLTALMAVAIGTAATAQADEAPEIFTVITSPSPETQFMALILTTQAQLLRGLVERGTTVEVCAIFLPGREEGEGDLIEGVTVAAPPDVAAHMIRPNVRYFTF